MTSKASTSKASTTATEAVRSDRPAFVADGLLASTLRANRLRVGPATSGPVASGGATLRVRVSWDGSWRNGANWDAAWLFVKWRSSPTAPWQHGRLASKGHRVASSDRSPAGAVTVAPDGMGAFVHRAVASASGANDWTVDLQWEAPAGARPADVRVMGVEMVYVPEGAFFAGDGVSDGSFLQKDTAAPARVDSDGGVLWSREIRTRAGESAVDAGNYVDEQFSDLVLGQTGIYVDGRGGINTRGSGVTVDNPDFPTGYRGFYVMKYEVTQQQYADFLNMLTPRQVDARDMSRERPSDDGRSDGILKDQTYDYYAHRGSIRHDGTRFFADHPLWPAPYVGWADGAAYLDWSGLRPMTELEFEKAARGSADPVAGEYAWGSDHIEKSTRLLTVDGALSEVEDGTEVTDGNASYASIFRLGGAGSKGPIRTGIFSETAAGDRESAGASFYGVMELSGNLNEQTVALDHVAGRRFRGTHGDGVLTAAGAATNADWPGRHAVGVICRGGNWRFGDNFLRVSDRAYMNNEASGRGYIDGIRGARTAPSV